MLNHTSALATTTNKEEHKMSSREHTEDVIDTDCMGNLVKKSLRSKINISRLS